LLRGSARVLLKEFKSVKLKKEKNRDEKGFKIFVNFIKVLNNILFIFSLKMFWAFRSPKFLIFLIIGDAAYASVGFSFHS
jgi:hypothetical protein